MSLKICYLSSSIFLLPYNICAWTMFICQLVYWIIPCFIQKTLFHLHFFSLFAHFCLLNQASGGKPEAFYFYMEQFYLLVKLCMAQNSQLPQITHQFILPNVVYMNQQIYYKFGSVSTCKPVFLHSYSSKPH